MNIKIIALLLIVAIAFVSFVDSMPDPGKKYGGSSHAPYYKKYKKHYYHYHHHYHNHKHKHKHSHKHKHKYTHSSHGHSSHGYNG
jgi:ABC-type nickel/cobalt efflux system permease component RcnA